MKLSWKENGVCETRNWPSGPRFEFVAAAISEARYSIAMSYVFIDLRNLPDFNRT